MSYKLLDQMWGHAGEARLTEAFNAKEIALKALIARRNKLASGSYVASRIQTYEKLSHSDGRTPLADVNQKITQVQGEITTLGGTYGPDGTVTIPGRHQTVEYDYALQQRGLTQVYIGQIPGKTGPFLNLLRWQDGTEIDTSRYPAGALEGARVGRGIYVMSAQGHLHIDKQLDRVRHHSSFLAGGRIACGGEIEVRNGRITYLNNNSGHYFPNILHFIQVLHELSKRVPMNFTVAAWDDNKFNGFGQPMGGVVEGPDPDGLMRHFFGVGDLDELYGYYNLLHAYSNILADRDRMNSLGLIWEPATVGANPRGVYKLGAPGAPANVRVSFQEARHLLNQAADPNRTPQSRGVGTNKVSTDQGDAQSWGRA